jgi:hypothetical protein
LLIVNKNTESEEKKIVAKTMFTKNLGQFLMVSKPCLNRANLTVKAALTPSLVNSILG